MNQSHESDELNCPYCGRQCTDDQLLALHKGHDHTDQLTPTERTEYENASAAEDEALRRYRLKVLLVVTVLYFGFLFAYRIVG